MDDPDNIPILQPPPLTGLRPDWAGCLSALPGRLAGVDPLLVVLNDPQRHTRSAVVLNELLARLDDPRPRLRLLVACGTHSYDTPRRQAFEAALASRINGAIESVAWHACRSAELPWVSPDGLWRAHPLLVQGDGPVLGIGSVEPHYFAGSTGAHKTLTIGCADWDSIQANHAAALSPGSRPFALHGNPIFDGVLAMLRQLQARRGVLAINVVQAGEAVLAAAGGDPIDSVAALQPVSRMVFGRTLDSPADALILDVRGPLAGSFYQADKALKNSEDAVRDGGLLVLRADCPEGVGQDHFVRLLRQAPGFAEAMAIVTARGYRLGDHKAIRLRHLTDPAQRGVRVVAVSTGLPREACDVLGIQKTPTVAEALRLHGIDPARHRVFGVHDAGNTVVTVEPAGRN